MDFESINRCEISEKSRKIVLNSLNSLNSQGLLENMSYLEKLKEFISTQTIIEKNEDRNRHSNVKSIKENTFNDEELEILSKLGVNKQVRKKIEIIKEIFGANARVNKAYKINFNNSRNPIEKLTIE
ncbi:hypothetical protein MYX76_09620, partial [Desulfobacterota bacterium AH_259_B03_O07]|nr:hypothetical protein [Desulfobacterota bacterium AH_259_B03_O07]